jgi:flagellar basal-body rod modification protein FlgD
MSTETSATSKINWGNISDLIAANSSSSTAQNTTKSLANKEVFLQLLVTQLKNQDPTKPAEGIEFVTQLAQFTQLEESMSLRQSVDDIKDTIHTALSDASTTQP